MANFDSFLKHLSKYAEEKGFKITQNKKVVTTIIKGSLENEKKFSALYCPCRRMTGNLKRDKKIIVHAYITKRKSGNSDTVSAVCSLRAENQKIIISLLKISY